MNKPIRLRLSRKKGARLVSPNGLPIKVVSRPSKYGNYRKTSSYDDVVIPEGMNPKSIKRKYAVEDFERDLNRGTQPWYYPTKEVIKHQLKGYNLACWCPLDEPCHADVLLRIANE